MENLTLAQLFDQSYEVYEQIESSRIENTDDLCRQTLERLKCAENKLDELHLFSDNEDLNEVSSNELRYFLLYPLIGWFYEFRPSKREQRPIDVKLAIDYYIKFFELCRNYDLIKNVPKEFDENDRSDRLLPSKEDRQRKIEKIKSKKLIEDSIRQLKSAANPDDETKRHLYTQQIKWWIQQSEEEIEALKEERKLLNFAREPIVEKVSESKRNFPIDGPFTIVPNRDRLYKEAVGGAGYPSLPTVTVQQFYDELLRENSKEPARVSSKTNDEHLEEIDDPVHRENVRRMDEFKDENPRGHGNRYNRS